MELLLKKNLSIQIFHFIKSLLIENFENDQKLLETK